MLGVGEAEVEGKSISEGEEKRSRVGELKGCLRTEFGIRAGSASACMMGCCAKENTAEW